jgi:S-formylglutathione hydrolase FrmB
MRSLSSFGTRLHERSFVANNAACGTLLAQMRSISFLSMACAWVCLSLVAGAKTSWNNPLKRADAAIRHETFHSTALNTQVGYNICLPPQYKEGGQERFPVIYYLHGYEGHESSYLEYTSYWKAAVARTGPAILVFVNGGETSFFSDAPDGSMPGETVFVRELVPHIDRRFRTDTNSSGRSLHGYSMGGFGALKLGSKYPGLFGSVVAYGATLPDAAEFKKHLGKVYAKAFGGDARRFADNDPIVLVEREADQIRGRVGIHLIIGTKDDFLPRNRALRDKLRALRIPHEYHEIPGAKHKKDDLYEAAAAKAFDFSAMHFARNPAKRPRSTSSERLLR